MAAHRYIFNLNNFISLLVIIFQKYLSSECCNWSIIIKNSRKLCIKKVIKITTSPRHVNILPISFHLNCHKYLFLPFEYKTMGHFTCAWMSADLNCWWITYSFSFHKNTSFTHTRIASAIYDGVVECLYS